MSSTTEATTVPPRRSSRISTRTHEEVEVKKPSKGKKRSAEEAKAGEKSAAKKTKADNANAESSSEKKEPDTVLTIDIGDSLPSITLKNENDEDVDVATLAFDKGLILFLVPKADTPGCTMQACGFRDIYPDFTGLNFSVYCLSADSPKAQGKWKTKKELPYALLSDPKRLLITALGAGQGGKTKRSHFIFEKGGKLVDKKIPVKPVDSPRLALEFITGL